MTAGTTLVPDSVESLNQLLRARSAPDPRIRRAVGTSYAVHAAVLAALLVAGSRRARTDYGQATSSGKLPVLPAYGVFEAPRAPRVVRPVAMPPPPEPAPAPAAAPAPAEPAKTVDTPPVEHAPEDVIREHKDTPRGRKGPAAVPSPGKAPAGKAAAASSTPTKAPPADLLPPASAGPGSPLGVIGGDADGGLSALAFTNQWYVARVRDIVYMNWGNPFLATPGPATPLEVGVRFRIDRDGSISGAHVEASSGNAAWDRAGLRAVENAKLPPLPRDYSASSVSVVYRFQFDAAASRR